jgi:uncharacterized protein (TIGR00661 family)
MRNVNNIHVVPPLIRDEVLHKTLNSGKYILVYMLNSGFAEQVISWHNEHKDIRLHVFRHEKDAPKELPVDETLTFHQLDATAFLDRMAGCEAYATTGGFESICEALYLQKPVMMIPAHIEQECNAFDAAISGAGITADEFNLSKLLEFVPSYRPDTTFSTWVNNANTMLVNGLKINNETETIMYPDFRTVSKNKKYKFAK